MRFYEFEKVEGSTLAVRQINRAADEIGKNSFDYEVYKTAAEMLDKQMLKSLAQWLEDSDTAPKEFIMKTIANHDPETFKKMYGDQDGYFSVMEPQQDLTDSEIQEGAEMIAYHKHPKDDKLWTFPDAYKDDAEVESPYMSNASMRQFLDALGYNPDFEDQSPVPAKEFIARTTQWLQKNIGKRSPEEPTTIDHSPGGATMIGGGKPEGYMNQMVKAHNEIARKVLAKYPEVTHFGFN
jgi:hypothetical protein